MSNPLPLLRLASIVLVPNSARSRVKKSKDLARYQSEQAKFSAKILRRSVRKNKKKTKDKFKEIDKFNKEELPKNYVSIKDFNALKDELNALKASKNEDNNTNNKNN